MLADECGAEDLLAAGEESGRKEPAASTTAGACSWSGSFSEVSSPGLWPTVVWWSGAECDRHQHLWVFERGRDRLSSLQNLTQGGAHIFQKILSVERGPRWRLWWPSFGSRQGQVREEATGDLQDLFFDKNFPRKLLHNLWKWKSFEQFLVIFVKHVQFLIRTRWGWKYSEDMFSIKLRNKGWRRTTRSWS